VKKKGHDTQTSTARETHNQNYWNNEQKKTTRKDYKEYQKLPEILKIILCTKTLPHKHTRDTLELQNNTTGIHFGKKKTISRVPEVQNIQIYQYCANVPTVQKEDQEIQQITKNNKKTKKAAE